MTLRSHLVALTLAVLLPVAAFAVYLVVALVDQDRDTFRRGAEERTLALMTAVDAELQGSIATVEALAVSPALEEGDLRAFRRLASRILESQPHWQNINLSLPQGQQVMNLLIPEGTKLPDIGQLDGSFQRLKESGGPVVSDLAIGPVTKRWSFAVRVPVDRDGRLRYVISASIKPDAIGQIMRAQRLPADWVGLVLDRNGRIIYRTRDPDERLGQLGSERLRAALQGSSSGWLRDHTLEGESVYRPYRRSEVTGWTVAVAIPRQTVDEAAWRAAALLLLGLAASIILAVLLARGISRRISRPIATLSEATEAMGRGYDVRLPAPARITEISRLHDALQIAALAVRERSDLLHREKEALQASDRAKDEFLAMLSHELRNPLAALTAAAHVTKLAPAGSEAAIKARAVIERQTKHMARLIGDLLDISRVAMGKVALERERFNLAKVVADVLNVWRASGRLERHFVSLGATAVWIDADRSRIEQVFSNLLDNALKFTPPGKRINVSVGPDGEQAVLRVADEGEGIAPSATARMFDLFVQGERGLDRAAGGLGIGLALVKRLTEMHGGTVTASSAGAGKGTLFTVSLPSVLPAAEPVEPQEITTRGSARQVLIVEDNDDTRAMLHEALAFSGHDVREARDGTSGLQLAAEKVPDVALIDIGLPDLDGYEVARRMRAAPGGRRIGLVAITGYGQAEDQRRAYEAGFDAHLTKPVAPERLKQVMAGLR